MAAAGRGGRGVADGRGMRFVAARPGTRTARLRQGDHERAGRSAGVHGSHPGHHDSHGLSDARTGRQRLRHSDGGHVIAGIDLWQDRDEGQRSLSGGAGDSHADVPRPRHRGQRRRRARTQQRTRTPRTAGLGEIHHIYMEHVSRSEAAHERRRATRRTVHCR